MILVRAAKVAQPFNKREVLNVYPISLLQNYEDIPVCNSTNRELLEFCAIIAFHKGTRTGRPFIKTPDDEGAFRLFVFIMDGIIM